MSCKSSPDSLTMAAPGRPLILRPLPVGDIVDEAFDLCKRDGRRQYLVAGLLMLPAGALGIQRFASNSWSWAEILAYIMATVVTAGALSRAVMDRILLQPVTLTTAFRAGASHSLRMLATLIAYSLTMNVGLLLLIVPGIVVMLWGPLLAPIVVTENRAGVAALGRAARLSAGGWGRLAALVLGQLLLLLLYAYILVFLLGLVLSLIPSDGEPAAESRSTTWADALPIVAGFLIFLILCQPVWSPIVAASCCLAYLDFRVRREAYDLELLTSAVEARAAVSFISPDLVGPTPYPPPWAREGAET